MKISLFSLLFVVFLASFAAAALCPKGDLNGDCKVHWEDIRLFAEQWLDPGGCSHSGCADFDGINGINMDDYAVLATVWGQRGVTPLVINEFMASNNNESDINDPQGDYDDWVEIYNYGDVNVNLAGFYLTDDLSEPDKWRIPYGYVADTTVPAHGFILFWADGDTGDGPLHADFKLSADGEEIGLFDIDGNTPIDTIVFGEQVTNISYGRYPDANDDWRFFAVPTPLADNNGFYAGLVEAPEFSKERGFYESSFDVSIATPTNGAVVYYTTDGSEPIVNEVNSPTSLPYTAAIHIDSNTCLRSAAIKEGGWMPSPSVTHTYIFNAPNEVKAMPVVSLVGDEYDTLFEPNGIMAIVGGYYSGGVWQSDGPDSYNNPMQRGRAYERPVSFEIIDPCTDTSLQENCGIRVHGSDYTRPRYTRGDDWSTCWIDWWPQTNTNKFSFNLWFRSSYGDSRLEYDFFPFIDIDRFRSIVLRAGMNDRCTPFVKDEWARRLFLEMGGVQVTGTFANLYLNGEYKAYYNPTARTDEEFFQEWYNTDNEFDVITNGGLRDGTWDEWTALRNYVYSHDMFYNEYYDYVASKFDIPTFIDFLILEIHIGNFDWPGNNWDLHRERSEDGIFRYSVWDAEGLAEAWYFGSSCENCADTAFEDFPTWAGTKGLNHYTDDICKLYRALKANPEFRQLFADHIHRHFRNGGILTEEHLLAKWWEVFAEVNDVLPETEHYPVRFVPDTFIPVREPYVMAAFEENGLFNLDLEAPVFYINGGYQHGGYISAGDTLTIIDPCSAGTIYYTLDGNDPRLPAGGGTGPSTTVLVLEDAAKKVLVPTGNIGTSWRGGSEPYDDSSWTSGTGGVGYERSSGYESYIDIDVEADMYGNNATCYIRIPFTVDGGELPDYTSLELRMRYDDGFVAYINGAEVHRVNFSGTPAWDSSASGSHEASASWDSYDISDHIGELQAGSNILAIHGLNYSATSSDFLICAELEAESGGTGGEEPNVSPSAIEYAGLVSLNRSTHVKSRVLSDSNEWSALNEAVYALPEVVNSVRITELMYNPMDTGKPNDEDTEYLELKNISGSSINLNLVKFDDGIDFTFGPVELAAGGHVLVVKDTTAFEAKHGTGHNIAGDYTGSLNNGGERIRLEDATGTTILDFDYGDDWRAITDGDGYSLTIINPANPDVNSWGEKDSWRASAYINGSPGTDDSGIVPNPGAIVINEVMTHSHGGTPDWIELYNSTASPVNIGGWYLSDSDSNLMKYEIASGTIIGSGQYLVFYEDTNFGESATDPGRHIPFALSENGEMVCLTSALDANGVLTGYRQKEDFGASETGVSFGRYYKSSTGNTNFVAMDHNTPGLANAYPKVGPIVINEIMYHPNWPEGGSYENDQYEYIELYNNSGSSVTLYDYVENEPWKFTDAIDYNFPSPPNEVTIAPGGRILVVKNPDAFAWRYPGVSPDIVFGPYDGKLNNGGEKVQISMPGDEDAGTRYYIRVDRVGYSDGSHPQDCPGGVDLWPVEADGAGKSLTRISTTLYGNDPNNWQAATPTPGT